MNGTNLILEKLIDVNNDGKNELLLSGQKFPDNYNDSLSKSLTCYNYEGEPIWYYTFNEKVKTGIEYTTTYNIGIIDTLTFHNKKVLLVFATNIPLYPSAVFMLDPKTGKRIDSAFAFWNSGSITQGMIGDFNLDGDKELVALGINNGYSRAVFFSINLNQLYGKSPAPERYSFKGMDLAKFNAYVLLPLSDYGKYYFRYNFPDYGSFEYYPKSKEFGFFVWEGDASLNGAILVYRFNKKMQLTMLDCGDDFQKKRDSLVVKGILNPPLTNTTEYFDSLKKQLRYWDGTIFVTAEEYFKKYKT